MSWANQDDDSPYLPPRKREHHQAERGEGDEQREREEYELAKEALCNS